MKYFFSFLLILLYASSLSAQERYSHELKGFEDSTGVTSLFYQLTEVYTHPEYGNLTTDFLYIIQENNFKDSLLADFGFYTQPLSYPFRSSLEGFVPISKNQTFIQSSFSEGDNIGNSVSDTESNFSLATMLVWLTNINFSKSVPDSLYISYSGYGTVSIPLDSNTGIDTTLFKGLDLYQYFDNNYREFEILDFSPFQDSVGFIIDGSGLSKSEDMLNSFSSINFDGFDNTDFSETKSRLLFDKDSVHIYSLVQKQFIISDDFGDSDSWKQIDLTETVNNPSLLIIDNSVSGSLFIADSNSVYHSTNFGTSFDKLLDFDSQITGLYKKPSSDVLYVLTRTDLYKVESGQPTSIKQLPVSNEETPEIPSSVSLKQNYPNPFNPATTIEFELDQATFARLTVYDVLGRKVRELVNEIRPAGTNTIQFNATNLASGIYLYRLEANGIVQTKRLTLIK
jgi:hypothetical protein